MPTLLEIERAVYRSLVERDNAVAAYVLTDGLAPAARLDVYRNTFIGTLTTALRLSFPAVHRLVGDEFFDGAAGRFIQAEPPCSAYLNDYGADFPAFLDTFEPAASLPYLSDVARLEWAVSRAIHAPDAGPLDISRLSTIHPGDYCRISFVPHPSVGLIRAGYPADQIWRSVLARDDAAMAAIELATGTVWLLVQRLEAGLGVKRLSEPAWRFMAALCAGEPLQAAIDSAPELDVATSLAEHLAAGGFVGFEMAGRGRPARRR
jgi:hypothetical protein